MSETVAAPVPDPIPTATPPTPAPDPVPASPVVEATPEPVAAEAPPAEAAPAPEPAAPESLLTKAEPELPPEPEPAPPLEYGEFTWPEGVTANAEEVKPYTDILAKHQVPKEAAQELVNLYTKQMQLYVETRAQAWKDTQQQWREAFTADPDIGGNRQDTTLRRAAGVIERFGGTPEQVQELREVLTLTGAGNHPAVIRAFHNISRVLREGAPVPAVAAKAPPQRGSASSRYVNSPTMPMNGAA